MKVTFCNFWVEELDRMPNKMKIPVSMLRVENFYTNE
jgi:hypothetical protein